MNILITGGAGYIGNTLATQLSSKYNITIIHRNILNLTDVSAVEEYFSDKYFDVVVHAAVKGGSRLRPDDASVIDDNLMMYYNLLRVRSKFGKFLHIGSGAELFSKETPYGLSKHVIRTSLLDKENFYNLRVFAVFDEHELETRFIKANILRYLRGEDLLIHQNVRMDFFYMEDFVTLVSHYIEQNELPKEYDCTYDHTPSLCEIAESINGLNQRNVNVVLQNPLEPERKYHGTYTPLDIQYKGLEAGIKTVYEKLLWKK